MERLFQPLTLALIAFAILYSLWQIIFGAAEIQFFVVLGFAILFGVFFIATWRKPPEK